jgi:hypothetical protein
MKIIAPSMGDFEPENELFLYTEEMRQFAAAMWQGTFWFLAERKTLHTDVDLLAFCRKTLNKSHEPEQNLAFLAGWFQALYHCESAPTPPENTPYMQLGRTPILLTQGRSLENGYFAGHDSFCKKRPFTAHVARSTPPPDTSEHSDTLWVILSVRRSDLDDRPLADKVYDAGMLIGWYLSAVRLSPHFSRIRLKENAIPIPQPPSRM